MYFDSSSSRISGYRATLIYGECGYRLFRAKSMTGPCITAVEYHWFIIECRDSGGMSSILFRFIITEYWLARLVCKVIYYTSLTNSFTYRVLMTFSWLCCQLINSQVHPLGLLSTASVSLYFGVLAVGPSLILRQATVNRPTHLTYGL